MTALVLAYQLLDILMPKLDILVQVLTLMFFIATGCATRSGQRLYIGSTGAPYNDRMPTHTHAEPSGIGRQHVQNIGKMVT